MTGGGPAAALTFEGPLWHWRGPAPYYFVRVPADLVDELTEIAAEVTYGWGMVPVAVSVGGFTWETSLWPKDGGYLVPIRSQVRRDLDLEADDPVRVDLTVVSREGRPRDPRTGAPERNRVRRTQVE